ncbi:unnamed protein product, partial [Penicillium salamii]
TLEPPQWRGGPRVMRVTRGSLPGLVANHLSRLHILKSNKIVGFDSTNSYYLGVLYCSVAL